MLNLCLRVGERQKSAQPNHHVSQRFGVIAVVAGLFLNLDAKLTSGSGNEPI